MRPAAAWPLRVTKGSPATALRPVGKRAGKRTFGPDDCWATLVKASLLGNAKAGASRLLGSENWVLSDARVLAATSRAGPGIFLWAAFAR